MDESNRRGWSKEAITEILLKRNQKREAVALARATRLSLADLEQDIEDRPVGSETFTPLDTQRNLLLHIHNRRHRLADSDGVSAKAAIDGLVRCKILEDDRAENIGQVTQSQELITTDQPEETIIEIWE